jgi:hypothetical protein
LPQAPQWATVLARAASQPLLADRSQSAKPAPQTKLHAPATHTSLALGRDGHVTPQPPQLPGSLRVLTQVPLHADCPLEHDATQAPAVHT